MKLVTILVMLLAIIAVGCGGASGLTEAEVLELIRANAGQGTTGAQGPAGQSGPQGIPGPKGDTGDEGPAGTQGEQGTLGEKGDTGAMGMEGTHGAQGPAGERGPAGSQGSDGVGLAGPQGPKGDQGEQGPPGEAFMTVEWEVPPNDAIGDGIWRVGTDIQPGLYRTMADNCYWARLRNLTGRDDLIANNGTDGPKYVEILATDVAFSSTRCGPWAKVEE